MDISLSKLLFDNHKFINATAAARITVKVMIIGDLIAIII